MHANNTTCSTLTSGHLQSNIHKHTHAGAQRILFSQELTPVSWCQFTGWFQVNTGSPESPSSMCKQTQKGTQTSPHPAFFLCVFVTVMSRGDGKKRNELSSSRVLVAAAVAAATVAAAQLCRHLRARASIHSSWESGVNDYRRKMSWCSCTASSSTPVLPDTDASHSVLSCPPYSPPSLSSLLPLPPLSLCPSLLPYLFTHSLSQPHSTICGRVCCQTGEHPPTPPTTHSLSLCLSVCVSLFLSPPASDCTLQSVATSSYRERKRGKALSSRE